MTFLRLVKLAINYWPVAKNVGRMCELEEPKKEIIKNEDNMKIIAVSYFCFYKQEL